MASLILTIDTIDTIDTIAAGLASLPGTVIDLAWPASTALAAIATLDGQGLCMNCARSVSGTQA